MQVFLPFPNISLSLKCLDKRRLAKQRVEARQIINILKEKEKGINGVAWGNHPAVLMFAGYIDFLSLYYNESLKEFANRGGCNNVCQPIDLTDCLDTVLVPFWFGDPSFHNSHKSNLLRKAIEDSTLKFRPELLDRLRCCGITEETTDPKLEYVWPVRKKVGV